MCLLLFWVTDNRGLGKHLQCHVCFFSHRVLTTCWHAPLKCCSADIICTIRTFARVHVDLLYLHVNTYKHKLAKMLYLLPISSISQVREKSEEAALLLSTRLGASCSDRGPSRDTPERSCWSKGGKSWLFWIPFNDLESYLTWVWYASTS